MESSNLKVFRKPLIKLSIALLLGALGSGVWEFFLRDISVWVGNFILTFISSIWGGYVDLLHREIGKLYQDSLIMPVFVLIVGFFLFLPWLAIVVLLKRGASLRDGAAELRDNLKVFDVVDRGVPHNQGQLLASETGEIYRRRLKQVETREEAETELNKLDDSIKNTGRMIFGMLIPLATICTFSIATLGWQVTYTRNAANWAERSTEILIPYISQQEYLMLRSNLRAVDDAESFYKLEKKLRDYAITKSIRLPTFSVIHRQGT